MREIFGLNIFGRRQRLSNSVFGAIVVAMALTAQPAAAQQQPQGNKPPATKPAPAAKAAPAKPPTQTPPPPPAPTVNAKGWPVIETTGTHALLIDASTGTILMDKNADQRMYPSSMTKMLTTHIVFEKLKKGDLKMTDEITVSEKAWRTGGSKMFIEVGSRVTVQDLLHGAVIASGNDACVALAEGISGTEEAFADEMNRHAKIIGMTDSNFRNASGWPVPDHWTTAHDLAVLALSTIRNFPEYYGMYAQREYTFNNIKQGNRNPLLYDFPGADGLKTGHTEIAGYGLTGSAVREGRRLVLVVNGLKSLKDRAQETARLMDWGFREFDSYLVGKPGDPLTDVPVWLGAQPSVSVTVKDSAYVTLPRRLRKDMVAVAKFDGPVEAPVLKGQPVGKLVVTAPGTDPIEIPLVAAADVPELGLFGRVGAAMRHYVLGSAQ
ncbi:MAG: D-alanyl-D-alanine carboxypeptidase family protein [Elstera sp.]